MTICTPWRVANSLNQLLAQANALAPNRKKGADGSIGDAAHQSELCASQHNSCCIKVAGIWIIRARDFTHDPAGGFDSYAFAEQLRLSRDPRIRYIISNRQITSASRGWKWEAYSGSDPHTNHAHVSVWDDQPRFDDTSRAWRITSPAAAPQEDDMPISFPTFFGCAGDAKSPTFFGTPGQTCSWVKPGADGKVQSGAEATSLQALISGKWTDGQFATANHSWAANPPVARNLVNIVGDIPPGYEDRAVDKAGLDTAAVVTGVLQGLANDDASDITQGDVDRIAAAVRSQFVTDPLN